MCGIVGLLHCDGEPVSPDVVKAMRDVLEHRGPDGDGLYVDGNIGLGHRRLSIIDLRAIANQPMLSTDGRWSLVFNGEIYNHLDLRRDLEAEGWEFRTRSDTEVLLAACVLWGVREAALRINGMAAFALWDSVTRTLHLVRDRFGVKPLYVWRDSNRLAFASEIKAFLRHPQFSVRMNKSALREYFTFQNVFRSHTMFEGVVQIPAGTIVTISPGGEIAEKYWDFDFSSPQPIDANDAVVELERLLVSAVRRQMISDVPVGAYLSGGLDSGAIVSLAAPHVPRMQTFTAGFEMSRVHGIEATFDERRAAEIIACANGTEHYEQVINAGDIRWAMPRVVWHLEDLRLGMSYPNYYIARLASKFVKVCLSGAGGDELFGGYPWRYYRVFRSLDRADFFENYFKFWQRLTSAEDRAEMFSDGEGHEDEMFEVFKSVFGDTKALAFASPEDHIGASLYFECKTFLSGLLLVGDRLSMASGLEERFPFLDNELVDFAMRLPVSHKLSDLNRMLSIDEDAVKKKLIAEEAFDTGKSCLRRALVDVVPEDVRNRKKQGFSSPEASWLRGENADYVKDMLLAPDLASADFISGDFSRKVVADHMSGEKNNRLLIWSLLSFEQWCRTFIGGEYPPAGLGS